MNARIADNVGTPQLKQFLMVNIKTEFPRGINSDQVISGASATASVQRAPGPGLNLLAGSSDPVHGQQPPLESGATSFKQQAQRDSSFKRQASSPKHKGSSAKPQAASSWTMDPGKSFTVDGPRVSTRINELLGWRT